MKVSVCVISYNSSATVIDTLDSVKYQSYPLEKIELIISDDGSTDNTKEKISYWLENNRNNFYDVKLKFNSVNVGVSENCNIALRSSTSKWTKLIAADDILLSNCLEKNVAYVVRNSKSKVVISQFVLFDESNKRICTKPDNYESKFFSLNVDEQLTYLLTRSFNFAPSAFLNTSFIMKELGGYNKSYKLLEDLPMWIKVTSSGQRLDFFPEETVRYRQSSSITNSTIRYTNLNFRRSEEVIYVNEVYPRLNFLSRNWLKYDRKLAFLIDKLLVGILGNDRRKVSNFARLLYFIFRPKFVISKILKHIHIIRG